MLSQFKNSGDEKSWDGLWCDKCDSGICDAFCCPHILGVTKKKRTFAAMVAYFIHTVPSCLVVSHIFCTDGVISLTPTDQY